MTRLSPSLRLFSVSFLLLFCELALIRWLPSEVRVLSYFTNLVLLASFLGIGIGSLLARLRPGLWWLFPPLLALALLLGRVFSSVLVVERGEVDHHLWTIYVDLSPAAVSMGMLPTLVIFFCATAVVFVPLGQELGRLFRGMRPLRAYSIDILGSLAGSIALTLMAAGSLPPIAWFAVAGLVFLLATPAAHRRPLSLAVIVLGFATGALIVRPRGDERWTPYYRVQVKPFAAGFDVTVNASLHQSALDLSADACAKSPELAYIRDQYAVPYSIYRDVHDRNPRSVLILGAGSGNDAEVARQQGISRIVVVEIDPAIARMGFDLHPNRPYRDPRVEVHTTDARSFLQRTRETFDLILFGTLDSQTLLSGMSTTRLDDYVYTRESLAAAEARLADGGVIGLFFMVVRDWISRRLFRLAEAVDGVPPLIYRPEVSGQLHVTPIFNWLMITGPGARSIGADRRRAAAAQVGPVRLPTDDWPYLYLREPGVPRLYARTLLILLGLSLAAVLPLIAAGRRSGAARPRSMAFYFCMGAGFLLLETKSITKLALLFGSTWKVSAVVISAVLLTILLANLISARKDWSRSRWLFPSLGGSLALNYAVPAHRFLALPPGMSEVLAALFVSLPIFFAGLLFARRFRTEIDPDRAFGWNLLGAMTGGLSEYVSMATGINFLYVLAGIFYLAALASDIGGFGAPARGRVSAAPSAPPAPSEA